MGRGERKYLTVRSSGDARIVDRDCIVAALAQNLGDDGGSTFRREVVSSGQDIALAAPALLCVGRVARLAVSECVDFVLELGVIAKGGADRRRCALEVLGRRRDVAILGAQRRDDLGDIEARSYDRWTASGLAFTEGDQRVPITSQAFREVPLDELVTWNREFVSALVDPGEHSRGDTKRPMPLLCIRLASVRVHVEHFVSPHRWVAVHAAVKPSLHGAGTRAIEASSIPSMLPQAFVGKVQSLLRPGGQGWSGSAVHCSRHGGSPRGWTILECAKFSMNHRRSDSLDGNAPAGDLLSVDGLAAGLAAAFRIRLRTSRAISRSLDVGSARPGRTNCSRSNAM